MNKKLIPIILIIILSISLFFILSIKDTRKKIVIVGGNFYPDIYINENNITQGYLYELSKKIMDDLELEYEIISTTWDNAQQMIKDGNADILLGASYSKSREDFLYYTNEQKNWDNSRPFPNDTIKLGEYRFLVKNKNKQKYENWTYKSLRDSKTRIGAISGTSIMDTLSKEKQNIYSFKDTSNALETLNNEIIDLFVGVNIGSEIDIIMNNLSNNLTLINKPLTQKPYFIVFSKKAEKNPLKEIRISFYNRLVKLKKTGEFYNIYNNELKKYGLEYSEFCF